MITITDNKKYSIYSQYRKFTYLTGMLHISGLQSKTVLQDFNLRQYNLVLSVIIYIIL